MKSAAALPEERKHALLPEMPVLDVGLGLGGLGEFVECFAGQPGPLQRC